jgi:hypothetical protein
MILYLSFFCLFSLFLAVKVRGNFPAFLGIFSSVVLMIIGITTPTIWNWSRVFGTAGLLPSHFLSTDDTSKFRYLFLLGSFGALLSGILFLLITQKQTNSNNSNNLKLNLDKIRDSSIVPVLGGITAMCLILGLGKSALLNQGYLEFSGSQTFLRAANAILPAAIISLGCSVRESKHSRLNIGLLCILFLIQAGRGSRVILILPIVLIVVYINNARGISRKLVITLFFTFSEIILMSLTFVARDSAGGILNLPRLIYLGIINSVGGDGLYKSFGRMCASLTSWAPTLIASIDQASGHVILANLNPLIGSGSDAFAYSSQGIERLFPYTWIPLSSMGQIYGAFGGLILISTFFTISSIAALSLVRRDEQNSLSVFSLLSVATYLVQFPLLFQYSSRIWLRVLWLMLVFSTFHLISMARPITHSRYRRGKI